MIHDILYIIYIYIYIKDYGLKELPPKLVIDPTKGVFWYGGDEFDQLQCSFLCTFFFFFFSFLVVECTFFVLKYVFEWHSMIRKDRVLSHLKKLKKEV